MKFLLQGELPASYSLRDMEEEEEKQRTLCYVGMIRAADVFYLIPVKGWESRFVKELNGKIAM